jgi:ferredoxin--NADP+ reductase
MNDPSTASIAADPVSENRVFLYEVVGLWPILNNNLIHSPIHRDGSVWLTIPYSQMGETMQRINRMGARIISIKPLKEEVEVNSPLKTGSQPNLPPH